MVATADQAANAYRLGVDGFGGAAQYVNCGAQKSGGFLAVAKCLADAKKSHLTTDLMVQKYRAKA
jgi:hypothetical protein